MNFYKHHLGDYASHTAHLTWDEDCAYTRLLRLYYQTEHPLGYSALIKIGGVGGVVLSEHPLSVLSDIYRVIKAEKSHQKVAVKAILSEFFTIESDGYHNKRADEEIARYQAQASTNRRIARERFVDGSLEDRSPNQIPEPDTRNQIKTKIPRSTKKTVPPNDWKPSAETAKAMTTEFAIPEGGIERYTQGFLDYCQAHQKAYSDFNAAFRNCVRQDWPKFRQNGGMKPTQKTAAQLLGFDRPQPKATPQADDDIPF
jgi:uncharacterized protein YdaU (DUF1376 family)